MNRLKQIIVSIILTILIAILFGSYATSAYNKVDVTLGQLQNLMKQQSEDLWNYDPNDLMYTFGGDFSMIRDGDAWKYSGNPNTSCLSENGHEWGTLMAKLRAVIDIDSDGTVYICSDNYNGYANADDVERFNQLACICELQSTRSSDATNYPSFFFSDIAARNPEYGIDTFQPGTREEYARYANDALSAAQQRWGTLPANNRIRDGYKMRILIVSYKNPNGENAGQERMFFGEAPDSPGPGKLRLIKVNSKTDERIPGIQFKIKRTGNNKAKTGYIQVIGKFGQNDIIPGSPTPSPSPSATESASAGNSGSKPDFTAPYPGEPGKKYLESEQDEDSNDQKEDRAIPGPITGVGQESDWRIEYTSFEKDATIFETDSNGEIYISGLMSGDYVAEEIEGEMSESFEIVPETTIFKVKKCPDGDVTKGDDSKAVIKNEPITTTVELNKTDMITGQPLNGAGFKLQNTDTGEWVTNPEAKKPQDKLSNDEANAHEFFTENGKISVPGLPPGNYKWIETTFPTNERTGGKYVALDKDAGGFSVSGGKGETVSVNAQNKPVGLFRKIIKGTDKGIQGIPFEFREYSIADEYPELMEGFTVGGASYKGSLADEHCTYKTCDEVDTKVPHYGVRADGSTYVWYTCSLHGFDGSHADAWEERRAKYNDDVKWANDHHVAREKGVKEINEGTSSGSGSGSGNNSEDPSSSANPTATTSASPSSSASSAPSESTSPSESANPSTSASASTDKSKTTIKDEYKNIVPELFEGQFYRGETDDEIELCPDIDTVLSTGFTDGRENYYFCTVHQNRGTVEELAKHTAEWNKQKEEHNKLVRLVNKVYAARQEDKNYTIREICEEIYPEIFSSDYFDGATDTQINNSTISDTVLSTGFTDGRENYEFCIHHGYKGDHEGLVKHTKEWNQGLEEYNKFIEKINKIYATINNKVEAGQNSDKKEHAIKSFFKMICSELFGGQYYRGETDDEINLCTEIDTVLSTGFTDGRENYYFCTVHQNRGTREELAKHTEQWNKEKEEHNKLVKLVNKTYAAIQEGKKYSIKELCKEIYPELFTGEYYAGETDSMIKLCYTKDTTRVYSDTDTTCTRHDRHTTKEKATQHVNEWNQARDERNKLVEKLNNIYAAVSSKISPSPSPSASSTPSESASPSASTTPSTTPSESPSATPEGETSKIKSLLESICPELFDENGEFYAGITDTGIKECLTTDTIISDGNLNWICMHHQKYGTYEELMEHIKEWNKEKDEHNRLVRLANKIYAAKEEGKGYTIKEIVEEIYPELFKGELYAGETDTEINKYVTSDTVLSSGFTDGRENYFFCLKHNYKGTQGGLGIHTEEWNKTKDEHDNLVEKINKLYSTIADQLKTENPGTENKNTIRAAFKMICSELFMGEFYDGETDSTINEYHYNDGIITDINGKAQCARHGYSGTQEEMAAHVMEWDNAVQQHNKLVKLVNKTYAAMQEGKKYSIKELCKEIYPELFTGEYYAGETDSMIKLCYTNDTTIVYSDTDTTCTRHDRHTTKEKATQHVNDWNRARDERNYIVEKINNLYNAVYGIKHKDSKETTSRATSVNGVREVTQVAATSNNGAGESTGGKRNNLTDENGNIDISPLVPDGDDGRGKFQYREIDEGMENPYFNNDHPDWTDFDYLGKTIVEDERRRMDIEGLIWVERSQDQKGGIDDPETVNGIYDEGLDQLLYPVEVCLKHNDQVIGQGVITTDGRYRIRVGGRDGSDIKYVTTEKEGTYVEFTYNGMKYQSVWPATLENEENGSKAVEKEEDRQAFNERYKTIISNDGDAMSNKVTDGTIINYEKLDVNGPYNYKRRVLYEGKVEGLFDGAESETFGGRDSDPIGDGVYSGLQKRPKANEVDGEPNTMQQATNGDTSIYSDNVYTYSSKTGGDKYQIKADTQTAGYQGIMNYKVEDDKIEHVNLGVYERTQPDIAIVNDIERVVTHINNEQYLYQYGANTQADKDYLNGGNLQGRFQNNVNYKYKRYLRPEQIQVDQTKQNENEQDPFVMTIYYRTEVTNQSSYLYMQPEIRTQYDLKYQAEVRDATQEVVQDKASRSGEDETDMAASMGEWQSSSPLGGTNANTPSGYQEAYNTLTDPIAPGQSKVFYTAYTLRRDNLKDLVYATKEMYFFNNIEVNAYTTTWYDDKGQERLVNGDGAYAAIDVDSAAGNSVPTTNYGQQEDGSWAPADADPTETFEDDNDVAPVFELKYETPAKISGTVYLDDIVKDGENYPEAKSVKDADRDAGTVQDYIGNGIREDGEVPVKDVKVELVELNAGGEEITNPETGNTMVRILEPKDKDKDNNALTTETFAVTKTKEDGTYSFEGFIPGEYIVKFTWGQHVAYKNPDTGADEDLTSTTQNGDIAYVQQYKSTVFNDEARYTEMTDMKGDTTTRNRWYIDGSKVEYSGKSNAIDDMEMRRKIDNDILNTGNNYEKDDSGITYNTGMTTDNEKMLTYPDLEENEVFSGRATSIVSRTPAFDVSQQENDYVTTKDKDEVEDKNKDIDSGYVEINLDGVDFGISERPKQDMELEKRIQRVSVKLANGQTLIDANVLWKEDKGNSREQRMEIKDITGEIKQVAYPKFEGEDIGTFKMEVDKEILQGSTMEVTYKYNIINESYLDYALSTEEDNKELPYEFHDKAQLNRYYKYGNAYNPNESIKEAEVEMSPSIIIDYLDNAMAWKKYNEADYHENDLWEEVTEDENNEEPHRITNLLYDGRFTDENRLYTNSYNKYPVANLQTQLIGEDDKDTGNIYKFYRTILRDTTKENMDSLASNYENKRYPEESEQLVKDTENPDRYKGQIYLKAKQISYDDVKFVASKELSDTNTDLNFYNVVEVAQINRTGGAIPEEIIPGDTDPTEIGHTDTSNLNYRGSSTVKEYTVEHDGGWASVVTITPPTGDSTNYNYMVWTAVGIAALAILGVGTLGIKKVLIPSKIEEQKENPKEDK